MAHSNLSTKELDASKLVFTRNLSPHAIPKPDSPEVWTQSVCADHMVTCHWGFASGWAAPYLQLYGPLQLMPTASVLRYATECFEGLKFYRAYDLKLGFFRPDCNTRIPLRISVTKPQRGNFCSGRRSIATEEPTRGISVPETDDDCDSGGFGFAKA